MTALAAPGDPLAARELAVLRGNVHRLGLTGLSFSYVHEASERPTRDRRRPFGGRAWVGDVDMTWRIRGFDTDASHMEVGLTFVQTPRGAAFVTARQRFGRATPLWLLEPLRARRTDRSLVMTTPRNRPATVSRLADRAVVDVRKVLSGWRGRLVVEVADNERQLGRALGTEPGAYSEIAAVTTTADGSGSPEAPVHIFVNPRVFDPLGPRGSQIVMSHEAAHVATGAAFSSMPAWLLEGFADFVALDGVDLPVTVTASQILARVRSVGPPAHLPGRSEFDAHNKALGASYESAWLACRLLGQRYGEARLISFYRAVDRSGSTARPFRTLLHTNERAFTRSWRGYLRRLAD